MTTNTQEVAYYELQDELKRYKEVPQAENVTQKEVDTVTKIDEKLGYKFDAEQFSKMIWVIRQDMTIKTENKYLKELLGY